jgi:hypothetical protein
MVQILVVNAYGAGSKGASYQLTLRVLGRLVKGGSLIERGSNDLADFVLDWENEVIDETSKSIVKHFDKLEMVFIVGDSSLLPWDPQCHQLVTLIHMCHFVRKPVLAMGSGAFHCFYALCTKGARYDFINGPLGDRLERLPLCTRYAIGSAAFPSAWLDSETGDAYSYDPTRNSWKPVCNVGINRMPSHGKPRSDDLLPTERKYGSDTRLLNEQEKVEAVLRDGEEMVNVRNSAAWHYSFRGIEMAKFVLKTPSEWHLNSEGAMPVEEGISVLADGQHGPAVVAYGNNLLILNEMNRGKSFEVVKMMISNFVKTMLGKVGAVKKEGDERTLLMHELFGRGREDDKVWQPVPAEMIKIAPTMAASLVPTTLSKGPMRVPARFGEEEKMKTDRQLSPRTAVMASNVMHVAGTADGYDYHALRSPRGHDTRGKKAPVAAKNMSRVRRKRLDIFLESQGHPEMQAVNKKAFKLAEKFRQHPDDINRAHRMDGYKPESAREFFGKKNLAAPKQHEPAPLKSNPLNAPPPKIDFSRPHTADNRRWEHGRKNEMKAAPEKGQDRPGTSNGWLNTMKTVNLYEHMHTDGSDVVDVHRSRPKSQPNSDMRRIRADLANNFLPERHPNLDRYRVPEGAKASTAVDANNGKEKGNRNDDTTAGATRLDDTLPVAGNDDVREVLLNTSHKPFNNLSKYDKLEELDKLEAAMDFKGTYTDVFRSEHEQRIHEYTEAKKKFIGPTFKTHFGKASQLPLRSNGVVGADGKYPDQPKGMAPLAVDWNLFLKTSPNPTGPKWK